MSIQALINFARSRVDPGVASSAQRLDQLVADESERTRRTRGAALKEYDYNHAVLVVREAPLTGAVLTGAGAEIRRYLEAVNQRPRDPLGRIVFATDQFVVDFAQEADAERYTPIYNFGTPVIQTNSTSGRQPRLYQYGGQLLANDIEGSSFVAWQDSWDYWLRVTRNVTGVDRHSLPFVAELTYRDQRRRGYLVSMHASAQSLIPGQNSFSFTMFVTYESPRRPVRAGAIERPTGFNILLGQATPDIQDIRLQRPNVGEL